MSGNKLADSKNRWDSRFTVSVLCVLASLMLLFAIYGYPPYGYFMALKAVVVVASCVSAYALWKQSKFLSPVSGLLVAIGAVHAFGKMRRYEWENFNWAAIVLFSVSILAVLGPPSYRWTVNNINSEAMRNRFWKGLVFIGRLASLYFRRNCYRNLFFQVTETRN